MPKYSDLIKELTDLKEDKPSIFKHINPESASRMSPADATTRYGTDHGGGVIFVVLRR